MKLKNISNLMVLGLALTMTAVGCRKNPYDANTIYGQKSAIAGHGLNNQLYGGQPFQSPRYTDTHPLPPLIPLTGDGHPGWIEDHESLKAQTIYFDYDKSAVKASEVSKTKAVVDYLKSHGAAAVRVEGNCDERGTEEYNRSLGERRALAVREKLVAAGIDPKQVDTVSYGEDHPAEPGHNEQAWSKNRRDDFTVLTPPR
jgi:peptidoglycan-associated lipoprotein